jgi:hypothetical protein
MKTLTMTVTVIALSSALFAAACGEDRADLTRAAGTSSASEVSSAFVGTWRPTAGTVTKTCPGLAASSEPIRVDLTWSADGNAGLVTNELGQCPFHANVTDSTASAAPNQGCAVSDGAYGFTTTAFASYTFTVSADGQTAIEERAGTVGHSDDAPSSICSFAGTAAYERAPSAP